MQKQKAPPAISTSAVPAAGSEGAASNAPSIQQNDAGVVTEGLPGSAGLMAVLGDGVPTPKDSERKNAVVAGEAMMAMFEAFADAPDAVAEDEAGQLSREQAAEGKLARRARRRARAARESELHRTVDTARLATPEEHVPVPLIQWKGACPCASSSVASIPDSKTTSAFRISCSSAVSIASSASGACRRNRRHRCVYLLPTPSILTPGRYQPMKHYN